MIKQEIDNEIKLVPEGYTRFEVQIEGCKIFADYCPKWIGGNTMHVEFRTVGINPISETGYRSHFIMGTEEDSGITKDNIQETLQELAEILAEEEKPVRAKKKKEERRDALEKERQEVEEHKAKQPALF